MGAKFAKKGTAFIKPEEGAGFVGEAQPLDGSAASTLFVQPDVAPAEPENTDGNFVRNFKKTLPQLREAVGGSIGMVGDAVGSQGMRDYGLGIYEKAKAEDEKLTRDSDSFSNVLEGKAGAGEFLSGAAGYVAGQALTTVATGGVGGMIGAQLAKRGIKEVVERGAESAIAKQVAEKVAKKGAMVGAAGAVGAQNLGMEAGAIYPEALDEAKKHGTLASDGGLQGGDLARAAGSAVAAAGVDTAMDALMFRGVAKGLRQEGQGMVKTMAKEAGKGMAREGVTEGIQTAIERFGANKELSTADAIREYVDSMAVGVVGGAMGGAAGGMVPAKAPQMDPNAGPLSRAANETLLLAHNPDPYIAFPDGSVGKRADFEAYIASFKHPDGTPDEARQMAARAKLLGMAPQELSDKEKTDKRAAESHEASQENIRNFSERRAPESLDEIYRKFSTPAAKAANLMMVPHASGQGYMLLPQNWLSLEDQVVALDVEKAASAQFKAQEAQAKEIEAAGKEARQAERSKAEYLQREQLRRASDLEAADARTQASDKARSQQARFAILDTVLADPAVTDHAAKFKAELKRAGYVKQDVRPEEQAHIERFRALDETFKANDEARAHDEEAQTAALEALVPEKKAVKAEGEPAKPKKPAKPGSLPDDLLAAAGRARNPKDFYEAAKAAGHKVTDPAVRAPLMQAFKDFKAKSAEEQKASIEAAAHEAATSPNNDLPEPTQAQKEAGNYKVGRVKLHGLDISIENPQGSVRRGVSPDGKKWENKLAHHYGYIRKTEGADGDHVDAFIGPNPDSDQVFVIDQVDPKTGKFDEHKVMLGFDSQDEADKAYHANYEKGWKGADNITELSVDNFKDWLNNGDTTQAFNPSNEASRAWKKMNLEQAAKNAEKVRAKTKPANNLAVDKDGEPLTLYRGEHGDVPDLTTRRGSISFSPNKASARHYADSPNDGGRDKAAVKPRVLEATLDIRNPFINTPDDPFLELSDVAEKLGQAEAIRIAKKFADAIQNTSNWLEDINGKDEFSGVADFLDQHPERVGELYFDAFHLLDDAGEVAKLKRLGYDGAIHGGNGETALEPEYKVFDKSQVTLAGEWADDLAALKQHPYDDAAFRKQVFGMKKDELEGRVKLHQDELQDGEDNGAPAELMEVAQARLAAVQDEIDRRAAKKPKALQERDNKIAANYKQQPQPAPAESGPAPIDPLNWNAKKLGETYSMEQLNDLYQQVRAEHSNRIVDGGPVDENTGLATKHHLNEEGRKKHAVLQRAQAIALEKRRAAKGAPAESGPAPTYVPPASVKEATDRWKHGSERTASHQAVKDAVAKALDDGVFYNNQMTDRVAQALGVTDEQRQAGEKQVEGGAFGYDVYLARKEVEQERADKANREAKARLGLKVGENVGKLKLQDGKLASAATVETLGDTNLTLIAKRGPQTIRIDTTYAGLEIYAERAGNDYLKDKQTKPTVETVDPEAAAEAEAKAEERAKRKDPKEIEHRRLMKERDASLTVGRGTFTNADGTKVLVVATDRHAATADDSTDYEVKFDGKPAGIFHMSRKTNEVSNFRAERGDMAALADAAEYFTKIHNHAYPPLSDEMKQWVMNGAQEFEQESKAKPKALQERDAKLAAKGAQHIEGKTAEPATPAVIANSLQKSADNTALDLRQAKAALLAEVDAAIAAVDEDAGITNAQDTELQAAQKDFEKARDAWNGKKEGATIEAVRAAEERVVAARKAARMLTFDVPGDGSFTVVNSKAKLQEFRDKIAKSTAFNPPAKKADKKPAAISSSPTTSIADMIEDGELSAAYELAKTIGKPFIFGKPQGDNAPQAYYDAEEVDVGGFKAWLGRTVKTGEKGRKEPMWHVIEATSGLSIRSASSKALALTQAKEAVKTAGKAKTQELVDKAGATSQAELEAQWLKVVPGVEDDILEAKEKEAAAEARRRKIEAMSPAERKKFLAEEEAAAKPAPKTDDALQDAIESDPRIRALHEGGVAREQVLQASQELADGDDSLVKDLARIGDVDLSSVTPVDYKGWKKANEHLGDFTLNNGHITVEVNKTTTGLQAKAMGSKSGPRLTEQQVVDWADKLSADVRAMEQLDAKNKDEAPAAPMPDAWTVPLEDYTAAKLARSEYREQLAEDAQAMAMFRDNAERDWIKALNERAKEGRIPDAVLDDLVARRGIQFVQATFRGVNEAGARGYLTPDVRGDDKPAKVASRGGSKAAPIADVGEKIGGAKKDTWTGFADQLGEVKDADIASQPLSKIWPTPDYQKMLDDGADPWTVAFMRAARDEVPAKPRTGYKVRAWAEKVQILRDAARKLATGELDARRARELLGGSRGLLGVNDRVDLYLAVGHGKSLEGVRISAGSYSVYKGVEYNPSRTIWTVEKPQAATAWSNFPRILAEGDTREAAIEAFKAVYGKLDLDKPATSREAKFDIYSQHGKPGYLIGKKIGRNYAKLAGPFESVKEARAWRDANHAELVKRLEKFKETPMERRDTNAPRVGVDMRAGLDVTPEQFRDTFGFRGVEFGNYVEQKKRQADLNAAYDALMDMAAVLNVPPKSLSLNGQLGLAFGARGSGGVNPASAHYEPGFIVINLTKKAGAGSLGHEWWHALDNYFSRNRNKAGDFMTGALDVSLAARGSKFQHDPDAGVRLEMVQAFGEVMKAIRATGMKKRSAELDGRRSKDYWTTDVEMSARAFEAYLIAKLGDQEAANDYLANIVSADYWKAQEALFGHDEADSYPYPTDAEMGVIRAGFDHFFQTIEAKPGEDGNVVLGNVDGFYSELQSAFQGAKQESMPASQWLSWLRANAAKLGVKKEEIQWSGIEDYLALKGSEKVGRDEVAAFLNENGVQITEVEKIAPSEDDIQTLLDDEAGEGMSREDAIEYLSQEEGRPKYGQYQLPGGENYRELLLTFPGKTNTDGLPAGYSLIDEGDGRWSFRGPSVSSRVFKSRELAIDAALKDAGSERVNGVGIAGEYRSGHWDESNVLAHVRFNDRIDADGKKVLFIEELQSDWGQEGKKKGFKTDESPRKATTATHKDEGYWEVRDQNGDFITNVMDYALPDADEAKALEVANARLQSQNASEMAQSNRPPVAPFVTDTKAWVALGIKRMIRYAAEHGYDRVAFVNGQQSADRYDLSKQIDRLHWSLENGKFDLRGEDVGHQFELASGVPADKLEDYVGKDVAKRLADAANKQSADKAYETVDVAGRYLLVNKTTDYTKTFRSEQERNDYIAERYGSGEAKMGVLDNAGLKTGGEGMKAFYDTIVPQVANDVLKKLGGSKVSLVDMRAPEPDGSDGQIAYGETQQNALHTSQPGFDITPELRARAMAGQALFAVNAWHYGNTSPFDLALLKDVAAKKDATSILKRIAAESKSADYRLLAQKLLAHGVASKVSLGDPNEHEFAVKSVDKRIFAAGYLPKEDKVFLYAPRKVEQNLLHEFVHAGTFKALRKGGLAARQMKELFKHVEQSGLLRGTYGMSNLDEFVAEGFSNPQFQALLAELPPPGDTRLKNAWQKFVSIVRRALGLEPGQITALEEFLKVGTDLMAENRDSVLASDEKVQGSADILGNVDPGAWAAKMGLPPQMSNKVSDLFASEKTLNWWHKTVGTQYHKAQVDSHFKAVYDAAQRYLTTISLLANEAADRAPSLLPKLETLKDLTKKPVSAEDSKAVGNAVFTGTLTDQKVYDDAELREKFKLNPGQIKLYREFRRATDKSLDDLGRSHLVAFLGSEYADVADALMAAPDIEAAGSIALRAMEARMEDGDRQKLVHEKVARIVQLKREGYAPLSRFGNHTVYAVDADGSQLYFGMTETAAEAAALARDLKSEYPQATISKGILSTEGHRLFSGITPDTIEAFAQAVGVSEDPAFQDYLKLVVNNRSALKRLIHRKGVAGFSQDTTRVLANFLTSNARQASKNLHAGEMKLAADAIPKEKGDVKDEAIKLIDYIQHPVEEAAKIRGLLFTNFIGGSIASAALNLTQPLTMTLPYLAQFQGAGQAGKSLLAAMRLAAQGDGAITDAALKKAITQAEREGKVSPQEIHNLQAEAMRTSKGLTIGGKEIVPAFAARKMALVWGGLFGLSEQFNRKATFIAAFKLGQTMSPAQLQKAGALTAYEFAVKAVEETQGVYNRGNKADWARGAVGATLMTFKQFSVAYLEFLMRLPPKERALALAILVVAAGANGLPFADDLDDLIETLAQALGYNLNLKQTKARLLTDTLGQGASDFVLHGFSGAGGLPLDVSLRMGMGNLLPATGLLKKGNDKATELAEVAGAAGGLAKKAGQAATHLLQGDVVGAYKDGIAATAIQNVFKAVDMMETGAYRDTKGRKVIDTDLSDAAVKALGFQPSDVARVQRNMGIVRDKIAVAKAVQGEISDAWAAGVMEKDASKVQEARARLKDWNEKNPDSRITVNAASIVRRVREMKMEKSDRLLKTAPKGMRAAMREEIN